MDNWIHEKKSNEKKIHDKKHENRGNHVLKHCFDSIPIGNYVSFTSCKNCANIFYSYFEWINERIERISDDKENRTNFLINLKIEQKHYQKQYDDYINNIGSLLTKLRLERQTIQSCWKDDMITINLFLLGLKEKNVIIETMSLEKKWVFYPTIIINMIHWL